MFTQPRRRHDTWTTRLIVTTCLCCVPTILLAAPPAPQQPDPGRPRAADLGIRIGILRPGRINAITDVTGVRVGHRTIVEEPGIRTGVTVVLPHGENLFQNKVPAAVVVGNGFGKFVGTTQIQELGLLESPIGLTNTLSTFAVGDALVRLSLQQPGNEDVRSINPVVGECNDGTLNDIRAMRVEIADVRAALDDARSGPVTEGSVGAGTGTRCMGWKGGIGTASRLTPGEHPWTVGILVQTNFNGVLNIGGAPVGRELGRYYLREQTDTDEQGSCIVIVATDAPLNSRQLRRLASRALLGLAGVGSPMTHGSGDYALAFSAHADCRVPARTAAAVRSPPVLRDGALSPLFQAAREATEEAVINSLLKATTVTGHRGRIAEAIPIEQVVEICKRHGVIRSAP